jgi:HK97 family phage prohead protease
MSGYTLQQNMRDHPEWFAPDKPSPSFQQFAALEARLNALESSAMQSKHIQALMDGVQEFVDAQLAPLKHQAELVQKRVQTLQSEVTVGDCVWSLLEIKDISEGERVLTGWATRFETDRIGDVVVPTGVRMSLPISLLIGHDHNKVVGQVVRASVDERDIQFTAKIARIDDSNSDQARLCDTAWDLVRTGDLVKGVSIGFLPLQSELIRDKNGAITGRRYLAWDWTELSIVPVPALPSAQILTVSAVRSTDQESAGHRQNPVHALQRQVATLQAAMAQLQDKIIPDYVGTWQAEDTYPRGAMCTHAGAMWIATEDTSERPGSGASRWKLCVKSPRVAQPRSEPNAATPRISKDEALRDNRRGNPHDWRRALQDRSEESACGHADRPRT